MAFIAEIRSQLLPLVDAVTAQLEAAEAEEDLLIIFMERLGPTGPLANSADFSATARSRLDALLARAQDVAFAFSADGDPH